MSQYKIIEKDNRGELINDVESLLKQGWHPVGGVALILLSKKDPNGNERVLYAQAMAI